MAKVLIIDDEEIIRERLKRLLELDDYETFIAEDGQSGLEIFDKERPEVALVDIKMPGMDGIEVLRRIKQKSEQTEVIIITGHGGIDTAIETMRQGAYGYIVKPIEYDELALDISRALEKQRAIAEQQNAEAALRESEERYRELINTSIDAVISVDPEMAILLWNPGAERIFGYTEKEVLGQSLMKIVPERYREAQQKGFVGFEKTGSGPIIGKTLELEGLRKDGTEVPIELSVSSRKAGGTYIATAIVRNISDRKQVEAELKKKMHDLEIFHKAAVGRELKMAELKNKIAELEEELKSR